MRPMNRDTVSIQSVPHKPPAILQSSSSLCSSYFYPHFSSRFSLLRSAPICHPTTIIFFSPPLLFIPTLGRHCTRTADVCNKSPDFSAPVLTVNRKWLTCISVLLLWAQAAFVYTIILLRTFTLINCLRSKEENTTEIQLSEMWEWEEKKVKLLRRRNICLNIKGIQMKVCLVNSESAKQTRDNCRDEPANMWIICSRSCLLQNDNTAPYRSKVARKCLLFCFAYVIIYACAFFFSCT